MPEGPKSARRRAAAGRQGAVAWRRWPPQDARRGAAGTWLAEWSMAELIIVDRDGTEHRVSGKVGVSIMETLRDLDYGCAAVCGAGRVGGCRRPRSPAVYVNLGRR